MSTRPQQIHFHRVRRANGRTFVETTIEQDLHVPAGSVLRLIPVGGCSVAYTLVVEPTANGLTCQIIPHFVSPSDSEVL